MGKQSMKNRVKEEEEKENIDDDEDIDSDDEDIDSDDDNEIVENKIEKPKTKSKSGKTTENNKKENDLDMKNKKSDDTETNISKSVNEESIEEIFENFDFKITFNDTGIIRELIKIISNSIGECPIKIIPNVGLVLIAMDGSHIILVHFILMKEDMKEFICDTKNNNPMIIGVNITDLNKIFQKFDKKEEITLTFTNKDKLMNFGIRKEGSKKIRNIKLHTINLENESIDIDSIYQSEFISTLNIKSDDFKQIIEDAEIIGADCLQIKTSEKELILNSMSTLGENEGIFPVEELIESTLKPTQGNSFALQFLKNLIYGKQTKIKLVYNGLIVVEYPIFTSSFLRYALAPRVDEEGYDEDDE